MSVPCLQWLSTADMEFCLVCSALNRFVVGSATVSYFELHLFPWKADCVVLAITFEKSAASSLLLPRWDFEGGSLKALMPFKARRAP